MTDSEALPDALADLPPSAELVYQVLCRTGPATHRTIVAETARPSRTVRYGLSRLVEADLVTKRPSTEDARQSVYHLDVSQVTDK